MLCGFFRTILVIACALSSIALLLAANVGTIGDQAAKSSIFLLELNFANMDVSSLFNGAEGATIAELGFADAYIFGMYGYCRGTQGNTVMTDDNTWEDINFTSSECTQSSIDYKFNPVTFIVDEINKHNTLGINVTESDIQLPGGLNDYVQTASHLSQVIYICSIIAICLTILVILCQLLCWCVGGATITIFFQNLAFISAVISSGCATGAFKYIETEFNRYGTTFGVHAQLSRNFLVLTWVGTAMSLLTIIVITFTRCCCFTRPQPIVYNRVL